VTATFRHNLVEGQVIVAINAKLLERARSLVSRGEP